MRELSRETLLNIIETDHVQCGEASALARIALAAMDSEPVAEVVSIYGDPEAFGEREIRPLVGIQQMPYGTKLYRHAQPAPVAYSDFESFWSSYIHPLAQDDELKGFAWDIWCAAMLQAGKSSAHVVDRPVAWHHTAKSKEENHSNCCFSYSPSHDFGPRYEKPQSQPHYLPERLDYDRALHFLSTEPRKVTPETVIGGSSPVIPDGSADMLRRWLAFGRGMQNAGCQLPHNLIVESEAMLAAAQHDTPALNPVQSVVTVPGKWIPVSERVLEVGVKVLCFPAEDEPIHAVFNGQLWLQDVSWSGSEEPIDNVIPVTVTHWMPLPAGPQEVR